MTHRWKDLIFASNLVTTKGPHTKLWAPKVVGVPALGILRLPLGNPGTKCHLDVGPEANHKLYYKGEGGGFTQVQVVVSLVSSRLHVACPSTKSAPIMH